MTLQQMKKLYEQGNHIALVKQQTITQDWFKLHPEFDGFTDAREYQLINKKHRYILDAYLDGCEVYFAVIGSSKFIKADNFISNYCEEYSYLCVPKSLENCYCLGSKENFDRLVQHGCKINGLWHDRVAYWWVCPQRGITQICEGSPAQLSSRYIEYDTIIQNWVYCPKETEDGTTNTKASTQTVDEPSKEQVSLSLVDPIVPINNFEEYGFTAVNTRLRGTIYEEVYCDRGHDTSFYGKVFNLRSDAPMSVTWDEKGTCSFKDEGTYDLTPIVKEVYPIFKKSLITDTIFRLDSDEEYVVVLSRLLGEIGAEYSPMSSLDDVPYDTERGLYHGQPVWLHAPYETSIRFYTVEYESVMDKEKELISTIDCTIEPIPLEALKNMPWVWEQYKALEL